MQTYNYIFKGYKIEIVFSGTPGWFDFYVDGKPRGCARASQLNKRIQEVIDDKEAAKYQPAIILEAITGALKGGAL